MIRGKDWVGIPKAAELMGYTRQGALRRLKRLNHKADGRLLHRDGPGSPWLVSVVVLSELKKIHERDYAVESIEGRLSDVEVRLLALRNTHNATKRRLTKRIDKHDEALRRLHESNKAIEDIFRETSG